MKTEWTFLWKAHDFHFNKEHNFGATVDQPTAESVGRANLLEAHLQSFQAKKRRAIEASNNLATYLSRYRFAQTKRNL